VGNLLVYSPLRDSLGLSRIRIAYTAGEAIGPELLTFFRAIGVNLKQLYGQTEASVFVAMQQDGGVKSDTCGPPVPWVEVKVSDSGEVLYRGPGVFKGYFKNEEATKAAFDGDWVKTGDAGFIDHDGHLKIVDRVKDVSRLSNGTLFAPKFLENKVKYSPFVKECVCVGQGRGFVAALVNIDAQAVGNWCERHNITYTSYTDLAQKPEVYDLIAEEIAKANGTLAGDEQLRGAQIHKFLILHKELDADDEEVTRTRKLRRGFIAEKYKDLIDALFSGAGHVTTQTKVTFEDGRTALVKADLGIRDVKRAA
jgi:long-chain acyl-CoA synthetase